MKPALIRWLLRLYPAKWRGEYGAEFEDLLLAEPLRPAVLLNVMSSALGQRIRDLHPTAKLVTLTIASMYAVCLPLSIPLWRLIVIPMTYALAQSGHLPRLAQTKPFEGFAILFLQLAPRMTAFAAYPVVLWLIRFRLAGSWTRRQKRMAAFFILGSGALCLLSAVLGFVAWRNGLVLTLHSIQPLTHLTPITTISGCFSLFAGSLLGFALLLQIPALAFFAAYLIRSEPRP